jgi:hypothetical protein
VVLCFAGAVENLLVDPFAVPAVSSPVCFGCRRLDLVVCSWFCCFFVRLVLVALVSLYLTLLALIYAAVLISFSNPILGVNNFSIPTWSWPT